MARKFILYSIVLLYSFQTTVAQTADSLINKGNILDNQFNNEYSIKSVSGTAVAVAALTGATVSGVTYGLECVFTDEEFHWQTLGAKMTIGAVKGIVRLLVPLPDWVLKLAFGASDVVGLTEYFEAKLENFFNYIAETVTDVKYILSSDFKTDLANSLNSLEDLLAEDVESLEDIHPSIEFSTSLPAVVNFDEEITTSNLTLTYGNFYYETSYEVWTLTTPGSSYIELQFNLESIPSEVFMTIIHLCSYSENEPNNGSSPIDIVINGQIFKDNYDLGYVYGDHSWHTDQWDIKNYLRTGINNIKINFEDDPWATTKYWIKHLSISEGKTFNMPPSLSNPQVTPSIGNESTEFKFSVHYYDADGNAPLSGEAKLNLFGQEIKTLVMSLESGTPHDGIYSCTTTLQIGQYYHRFYFLNSSNQEVVTDILTGPSVHNSSNLTIIPHLDCGTNENYEINLNYKINDVSFPSILLKVGENQGIEVPPGGKIQISVSTKGNYTFEKYRLLNDGELEWESGNITVIFYFTDFASGIFDLYIDFKYTPLILTVSGTVNNENNTLYDGTINLNLVSSQQNLSLSTSNGLFSFENVKGGVPLTVEASGTPVGYSINPEKIPVSNFWRDETDLRFTVSADDFIAPTIQLIHYPDLQSSLSDITFSWIGEDDVSIEDSLKYSYQLVGFDVSSSSLSNAKTVNYSLPNGIYKFIVKTWDEAGNSSNVPVEFSFVVNANPSIDQIEKFEKSIWSTKIIISTDGSSISENRIVLLPEHSLTNIESIIPVRLYRLNESNPCGSNHIIAETLNLDTVFISQNSEFIFNIPDDFPESNKLEYIIEWGEKCNFGWQENKPIPKGFPNLTKRGLFNCDITEDKYLDENYNLWRLATMDKKIPTDDRFINNSWTYFDKSNTNEVLINEKEVEYIEGSWISGERYTYLKCNDEKLIPIQDKLFVIIQEYQSERTYPEGTTLDSDFNRYVIKVLDQNGSIINSLYGEWKDYWLDLPDKSINDNIWLISKSYDGVNKSLSFTTIDQYGNALADAIPFFVADKSHSIYNRGVFPIGDNNVLLIFHDTWETIESDDRGNLCFQIRDTGGSVIKSTTIINPPLLDESIEKHDEYELSFAISDNSGRVWISYQHSRTSESSRFFYVVLNENGQIIKGPIQTPVERKLRICDRDGYIWATEGDSIYLTDTNFNEVAFPNIGMTSPNQNVGDIIARVLYESYSLFDRWSPISFAVNLDGNSLCDTLEVFNLPINQGIGVRNFTVALNNTNIFNSTILPESSKFKVSEIMQLGTNIFTMTQDHLLGGQVLVTFPLVVNYPPSVQNPIDDKQILEDYGDSLLVDNLNLVFDDQNGDTLTYSISSSGNSITISVIDSEIQVTTINDMFGLNEVVVTASDGTHSIRDTFNIEVTPVNDTPVVNDQVFSIKENSPNGTIVDTVLATDVDVNDILSYTITNGNINNTFAINSFNGEIKVNNSSQLDYETDSTFVLTIQVQDNGTGYLTDDATITIKLINVIETSIDEGTSYNFIKIYPNPTNDLLFVSIEGTNQQIVLVKIYDLLGQVLINHEINGLDNQTKFDINISTLSSGFYYISFDFGKTRIVRNFTVVR